MAYSIVVSLRAQREIENAIDYYADYSSDAPAHLIKVLQQAYITLEINLFFRIRYKNIRALKLKRFPYSLYFIINKDKNMVRILSCLHHKRNPSKRP